MNGNQVESKSNFRPGQSVYGAGSRSRRGDEDSFYGYNPTNKPSADLKIQPSFGDSLDLSPDNARMTERKLVLRDDEDKT